MILLTRREMGDGKKRWEKTFAWIRAIRIKFVVAYVILGIGGLILGSKVAGHEIDILVAVLSFLTIIISAIGIHFRDEASDWIAGFDKEFGGVGVIREGILEVKPLQTVGWILNVIGIGLSILQVVISPALIIIVFPIILLIIGANYITERIFLGHEIGPAFAFSMSFVWVYIAQKWAVTWGVILFAFFLFLLVFILVPYQDVGDYEAEKKSGKKTLTVKMGIDRVGQLMIGLALASLMVLYFAIIMLISS